MPVGGDVTRFSMGLMGFLRDSIHSGRLPYWNDLWGYGFPGIAESQMGVYYPPHLLLYGLCSLEVAYTASLVLHTLWAACGAAWAARTFGVSRIGSFLSGFAFAASGWFLIHLPHQWAATTGSWMPWAWGLAWRVSGSSEKLSKSWLLLAAVLTLQILPGHFQLGFITEVGVVVIALCRCFAGGWKGGVRIGLALSFMIPLGAAQLWPTYELAQLAANRRDFEYLSAFASPPTHLISLIAPKLFHQSPLWRPIIWDPFHAMPEEHLPYLGLAPLLLAAIAIRRQARSVAEVRCLTSLAIVMLLLSFGPYAPGFAYLIKLPGFSFFRAPSRWGLGMLLSLSLLSGRGFDLLSSAPHIKSFVVKFVLISSILIILAMSIFELALIATAGPGAPTLVTIARKIGRWAPWDEGESLPQVIAHSRRMQSDFRVQSALAKQGNLDPTLRNTRLSDQRFSIYRSELIGTCCCLGGLLACVWLTRNLRRLQLALLLLSVADLLLLVGQRPVDLAPLGRLTDQSSVLKRLSALSRGTRSIDPMGNFVMIAGLSPIAAYRTLDLPAMPQLTALAHSPLSRPNTKSQVISAMEAIGTGVRVLDPFELAEMQARPEPLRGWSRLETLDDPNLAGWLYGTDWVKQASQRATRFGLLWPDQPTAPWRLVPRSLPQEESRLLNLLSLPEHSQPEGILQVESVTPERVELDIAAVDLSDRQILAMQLYHPQWLAIWSGSSGERTKRVAEFSNRWQSWIPPDGLSDVHHVRLQYQPTSEHAGQLVSAVSWVVWLFCSILSKTGRASRLLGKFTLRNFKS